MVGGDAGIEQENWLDAPPQAELLNVQPADGATEIRALCNKPSTCPFRDQCTGKVTATLSSDNGFSKAIIHRVIFKDEEVFKRL